jgi:tetratricopeptide (TPR) repeat protein
MLTLVATPEWRAAVVAAIATEPRLAELVQVQVQVQLAGPEAAPAADDALFIGPAGLVNGVDWSEGLPPVVLAQPVPFTAGNLLALVFLRLGNWEKTYAYAAANEDLLADVDLLRRLQANVALEVPPPPLNDVGSFAHYRRWHNRAVALHYGHLPHPADAAALKQAYGRAITHAPGDAWAAFSTKHYATFLLDGGELGVARECLATALARPLDEAARHELLSVETGVLLQQLTVPYDAALLAEVKDKLWQVLGYYEREGRGPNAALTLLDAAQVANFSDSFAEALGYLNRAAGLLAAEDAPALLANVQYRKGVLLFTWAQQGNPQFYLPAMEAYQQALQVFTRNEAYEVFAEIQHHLGIIYSEIPDEVKKKSIWAAVSVSSFKQALEYFTRETHPYEYATVCNHYANALTKYPPSVQTDNFTKALVLYREALLVRTARAYPYERALTLLNFLEAAWLADLEKHAEPAALLAEMTGYAQEVGRLVQEPALAEDAREHLSRLETVHLT